MDFAVAVERLDDSAVVRVEGELDMASAPELEDAISRVISASHIVVDLGACTFLDSAGMRVITDTMGKGPRVSVVAPALAVLRVLEISAVDTMVNVHASVAEAL